MDKELLEQKAFRLHNLIIKLSAFVLMTPLIFHILNKLGTISSVYMLFNFKTSLLLACFSVLCFPLYKASNNIKNALLLPIYSIMITLYLIEFILFVTDASNEVDHEHKLRIKIAKEKGIPFDQRNIREVITDFKREGKMAYPYIYPPLFYNKNLVTKSGVRFIPLTGISNSITVHCNETGERTVFLSDEYGFNNKKNQHSLKDIDIVLIGDSFTLGSCVRSDQNIASWLTRNGHTVVNLGVSDTGPLVQLAILKEYAKDLRPKSLFWIYFGGNDPGNLNGEKKSSILRDYLRPGHKLNLKEYQEEIDDLLREVVKAKINPGPLTTFFLNAFRGIRLMKIRGVFIRALSALNKRHQISMPKIEDYPLLTQILTEAKRVVQSWGGKLYFVYIPPSAGGHIKGYKKDLSYKEVFNIVKKLDVKIIDVQEILDTHPNPLSLYPLGIIKHFTPQGYKLIADKLDENMTKAK